MKGKTAIRYSEATKKNALSLFSKGWTASEIAKKHKTTVPTVLYWKKTYPELVNETVVTSLSKNGIVKTKAKKKMPNNVTITLSEDNYKQIVRQAKDECRTVDGQIKYYVLNGIRNYSGIPF